MQSRHAWCCALLPLAAALCACGGYQDQLQRGQRYYERNDYEVALALWRDLERNAASLGAYDQTRYAYLRGMTDHRLGFSADARHWLAVARANELLHPGGLPTQWASRLDETLKQLGSAAPTISPGAEPVQRIEATP